MHYKAVINALKLLGFQVVLDYRFVLVFRKNERETLNIALNLEMFLGDFLLLDVYCFWTSKQLLNDNSYYLTAYPGFMHHLMWQHWNLQNHSASVNLPCLCGPELSGYTPGTAQTIWIWGQSEQAVLFLILFKKAKKPSS